MQKLLSKKRRPSEEENAVTSTEKKKLEKNVTKAETGADDNILENSETDAVIDAVIESDTENDEVAGVDSEAVEKDGEVAEEKSLEEESDESSTDKTSQAEGGAEDSPVETEDDTPIIATEESVESTEVESEETPTEKDDEEQQPSSDNPKKVEEEDAIQEPSEDEVQEERPTKLPDPLDPQAHLAYFNEDQIIEETINNSNKTVTDSIDANEAAETRVGKHSSRRFPWFALFRRKMKRGYSLEEGKVSTPEKKASELLVTFPEDGSSSSSSPKKHKKTRMRRAVRILAVVTALLFVSPFVADEIEGRILVQPSATIRPREEMDSVDSIVPTDIETGMDEETVGESRTDRSETPQKSQGDNSVAPSKSSRMDLIEKRKVALSFVTDVVHEVGPAGVRVDTETHMRDQSDSPQPPGYVQQGQGSGLIFSAQGLILTNAHVVEDANKVSVTLTDGRVYTCQVMGSDEIVDIAVLKIVPNGGGPPITNLPVAELGDSDMLSVGKIVIAVGSPGGLDNTVTMGIVSGLERSSTMVGIPHKKVDYIQTDAAINPGNSGGPLIDVESGKVVGINAAIRAHMEGTSFAIPINRVRAIMSDLAEGREIQHGYLGLGLASCTPDWARQNNADSGGSPPIPEVYGAIIHKVFPKTPAENGGLRENDIILEIGSQKVKSAEDARRLIDLASVGKDMPIVVLRGQRQTTVTVRPVDLAARLREMRRERQQQMQHDRQRFQELGPFRSMLQ
jgi:S1-C subfamily serine protease